MQSGPCSLRRSIHSKGDGARLCPQLASTAPATGKATQPTECYGGTRRQAAPRLVGLVRVRRNKRRGPSAERISYASIQYGMEGRLPIRADPGILAALFVIGLSASLPAGVLYWLMRPTILPNPGMSAYRPPRPDPLFPLIARETRDPYALSIAAAKQENGLLRADARSALAAAQDAEPTAGGLASTTLRPQRRQRSARTQSRQQNPSVSAHEPAAPFNTWANRDRSFASWYR
jgi:hypothetical protein